MAEPKPIPLEHDLQLLETIEQNPNVTQADLAAQLGIAVGTVNWYIKRMMSKGYVKIRQLERRRLLYLITPRGILRKSKLGIAYLKVSMQLYRETRIQATQLLKRARAAGFDEISIQADGDLAEICRLTCLEQGISLAKSTRKNIVPRISWVGMRMKLEIPEK
ncbi:MAG: winged helix-turn-helix transcriptional regulator [Chloroflexi bacterium]|nr:winged helix-turn-helix transcriptional regulator [Chloroflexota bacterium]MBI3741881.1 winged helix-turn-helix transcriptional regulator [Chloroflexota bacterium]